MVSNPGGVVDPDDLIGREAESRRLMKSIDTGGAKLLGDRRMGKTSLLKKLVKDLATAGHTVIRISAEATDAHQFSREMVDELQRSPHLKPHLARWKGELGGEVRVGVGPAGVVLKGAVSRDGTPRSTSSAPVRPPWRSGGRTEWSLSSTRSRLLRPSWRTRIRAHRRRSCGLFGCHANSWRASRW